MKNSHHFWPLLLATLFLACCGPYKKDSVVKSIGIDKFSRVVGLDPNDFDQNDDGLCKFSGNYELVPLVVLEYLEANELSGSSARNIL